jgi:hypothetical protein
VRALGYLFKGSLRFRYTDGCEEVVSVGEADYASNTNERAAQELVTYAMKVRTRRKRGLLSSSSATRT